MNQNNQWIPLEKAWHSLQKNSTGYIEAGLLNYKQLLTFF